MGIPGIRAGATAAKTTGRVAFRLGAATTRGLGERARSLSVAPQEAAPPAEPASEGSGRGAGDQTARAEQRRRGRSR
eukprot:8923789-Alexandrium_andersonii.AAC.1